MKINYFLLIVFSYIAIFTGDIFAQSEATDKVKASVANEIADPLEGLNRKFFWFNDKLDTYVVEPTAQGYHDYLPQEVRSSIYNFFDNLRYPMYLVSDVFQFKFKQAGKHSARFAINTTIGVAGFFDFASDWGFERNYQDFGMALASYGIGEGLYVVAPIFGPYTLRDAFGGVVDASLAPILHIPDIKFEPRVENNLTAGLITATFVSNRESYLDTVESSESASIDKYIFTRQAYQQNREELLREDRDPETKEFGRIFP